MAGRFFLMFFGFAFMVVGYFLQQAGYSLSLAAPPPWLAWIPFLGSVYQLAGMLGQVGFWMVILGISIIIITLLSFIFIRPHVRGSRGQPQQPQYKN